MKKAMRDMGVPSKTYRWTYIWISSTYSKMYRHDGTAASTCCRAYCNKNELTRDVSRETATAADVIPAITILRHVLSQEDDGGSGEALC
ncbi:zinc finger BED domain-containing protein 4-like [Tachysurus ichikawai]